MRFHQKICDLIEDREDLTLTAVAEKSEFLYSICQSLKIKEQLVLPFSEVIICTK